MFSLSIFLVSIIWIISLVILPTAYGQHQATPEEERAYQAALEAYINIDDADVMASKSKTVNTLPQGVIPVIIKMLHSPQSSQGKENLVSILAFKLDEYRATISPSNRQAAIDVIVEQCEHANHEELTAMLVDIQSFKDPKIDRMLLAFQQSQDQQIRDLATYWIKERAK